MAYDDPRVTSVACERPNLLVCRGCEKSVAAICGTTRSDSCGPCGEAHRARVALVAASGMVPRKRGRTVVSPDGLFVTLTAPGDTPHAVGRSDRLCSCTPERTPAEQETWLARWNGRSAAAFNRFMQDLRRAFGDDLEYFKSAEVQKRGALHYHLIVRRRDGGVLALPVLRVRAIAVKHGFGHSVDVQRYDPKHAGYVAKYVAKASNERVKVPWSGRRHRTLERVNKTTGELTRHRHVIENSQAPTYRTWTASRGFGEPMRLVRAAQGHWRDLMTVLPAWGSEDGGRTWGDSSGAMRSAELAPVRPDQDAAPQLVGGQ